MSANWFSAFTKRRRFPAFCTSRSQISSSDHGSLCYSTVISANRVSGFVNSFRFPFFSSSPMTSLMSTTRCLSGRLLNVPSHLSLPTFVLPNCNSYHIPYKVNYRLLGTAPGFDKMDLKNNISTLVLGEHEGGFLKPSTLSAVSAASSISKNNSISILLGGSDSDLEKAASHAASVHPMVSQVLVANAGIFTHPLAEIWAGLVHMVQQKGGYSYIISASTSFGKNVLPRAAAILDVSPITDVTEISDGHLFVRPIYAGNALCKVRYTGSDPCMMTIRSTSFPALSIPTEASFDAAPISQVDLSTFNKEIHGKSRWLKLSSQETNRPDLGNARIVVTGGRGLRSSENFKLLDQLAERLGAAVGATRAAVDANFVQNELQVGQTGKIVAPHLYMAFGVSGAIQHLAGMRDSKVIVAVNKDVDAPIFQVADYGLVADLFDVIPELIEKLPEKK